MTISRRAGRKTESTSPPAHYEWHSFISYTTREEEVRIIKPFIDEYIDLLQRRGVRVCPVYYDGWYLRDRYYDNVTLETELQDGIGRSAFTTAFLSPGYLTSNWCCYEWRTTRNEHRKRVCPAPVYSILPICWKKPLERTSRGGCANEILPTGYLDLSLSFASDRQRALKTAISETLIYLDAWYPEQGWAPWLRRAY